MPLKTGIKGLDKLLKGGLPERSCILIEGPPGMGKDVLGLQFLFEGLKGGNTCYYAFHGKTLDEVEKKFKTYGMNVEKFVKGKKLFYINTSGGMKGDNVINCELKSLLTVSLAFKQFMKIKDKGPIRGLIDLISPGLMLNTPTMMYRFLHDLIKTFKNYDTTAVFTIEKGAHKVEDVTAIESLFDGIIEMKWVEKGLKAENLLRIKSMRGVKPEPKFYKFVLGKKGIQLKA